MVWWLNAENAGLLGEQFAALADRLGLAANAQDPAAVRDWLPGGPGHVLITSRVGGWDELGMTAEVDVLTPDESTAFLRSHVAGLSDADAGAVANAVGHLPLALAQAAVFLAETGIPAAQYVSSLHDHAAQLLDSGRPPSYG